MNRQPALNEAAYTPIPVFDTENCEQDLPVAKGAKTFISVVGPTATISEKADASMSTGQHPQAPRKNYKSCEFCARRKRRCDGDGFKRCSLCIEKNQPACVYREKPPNKAKTKPVSQQRRRTSGITSTKRPADVLAVRRPCGVMQPKYGTVVTPKFPLKRCRLSASPATGLVGMQENAFLDDYFGCLGLLPLANESIIRQAMVEVMMASIAPLMQVQHHGLESSAAVYAGDDATMTFGAHTCSPASRPDGQNDPSKCIMWCAIGLGALVQGAPVEKVTRYVELARASLADCFDGSTVETARAYMAMAVLHAFLGEGFMNRKYLAFATNIVKHLPKETVPEEIPNMLNTCVKSGCLWHTGDSLSGVDLQARLPPKEEVVDMRDVCNTLLVSDFQLSKAFAEDMSAQGVVVRDEGEQTQGVNGCDWAHQAILDAKSLTQPNLEAPTCGVKMKEFVKELMPALLRVSHLAVGSGATSGVGGLFYHGCMAYMKVIEGDRFQAYANIFHCAKVILRYPGICRFRPHLTHCILASSAVSYRPIYDQIRDIYNTLRPPDSKPAPPAEEWTGMSDICDHIFCRSLQAEIKDYNCVWDGTDPPDPLPPSKSSSCTDASGRGADGERSPSPPLPTTDLYPDKALKPLEISIPTSATKVGLSPGCRPNSASSEATVGQTGMWTAVEAGMRPAAAMTTDRLVIASTAPQPASPALSAIFPFPIKTSDARVSAPDASAGGNGMPVAEVVDTSNAVGASAADVTAGVLQRVSPQPLGLYEAETGVAINSQSTPAGANSPAVNPHISSPTSISMSDPTGAQTLASSAPSTAFCDRVGVDDSGFNLGVTDDTLKEAVEILLSEGLFEGEPAFQNVG